MIAPGTGIAVGPPVRRGSDLHTHSTLTDGTATPEQMADAAAAAGLTEWGLSDHVRADSTWLDEDYPARLRGLRRALTVRCGVEAKILDRSGRLDLPPRLPALDYVLIADHQFPGPDGPVSPGEIRRRLDVGRLDRHGVVDELVTATCRAVGNAPVRPIVAHLFSLLPKLGLSELDVSAEHRDALAAACLAAGAAVEVNEKWRTPSARTLVGLAAGGVQLLSGSDAHSCAAVGATAYLQVVERSWAEALALESGLGAPAIRLPQRTPG